MVNNVGVTISKLLNPILGGEAAPVLTSTDIEMKSGVIGEGCLVFDAAGTVGVVTNYSDDNHFIITTYALSIDLQKILTADY